MKLFLLFLIFVVNCLSKLLLSAVHLLIYLLILLTQIYHWTGLHVGVHKFIVTLRFFVSIINKIIKYIK